MKFLKIPLMLITVFSVFLFSVESEALVQAHFDYNGCFTCHRLHNGPSQNGPLLTEVDSESTCLGCHGPLGIATEVVIHDPNSNGVGNLGYITCLECHNPHSNGDPAEPGNPVDWPNEDGNYNTKMVGMRIDYNDTVNNPRPRLPFPQIRQEFRLPTDTDPIALGALQNVIFETSPADWGRADQRGLCNMCHGATHNTGGDCTSCHGHNDSFRGKGCTGCHDGLGLGAESISVDSPHSTNTIFSSKGVTYTCEDCHTGHSAGTIEIPNNTTVGINYGSNGESGIALGSTTATGTTEAEICWNCHAANGVSEWGLNSDTNGTGSDFDFGSLSGPVAPAWVNAAGDAGATWTSANFGYKTAAIQSTHSVSGNATQPGLDPVADIRCSYCHDVHELNALGSDSTSGKPYLRGTWMGNPYREDGAPQNGTNYGQYNWGNVPRGSVLNNEYGGYQIDQNNGNPTSGWTLTDSAGLCTLCHGTDVDAMNKFDVDEAGVAETSAQSWVGNNGHSNAVIGGTGSNRVNIFFTSDRAPSGVDTQGAKPDMGYANHGTGVGYGFRGTDGRSFRHIPGMDGSQASNSSRPYGGRYFEWGVTVNEGTTDVQYHKFSCSKCHNPHASRLPRLLITNCLDTKHNTWDENAGDGGPSRATSNNNGITLSASSAPDSWGRTWSNTTSAQNCHRVAGDNRGTPVPGFGSGWNNVTPW